MKKRILMILSSVLISTCMFSGCKKQEAAVQIPMDVEVEASADADEEIDAADYDDSNDYKEYIFQEAEKCIKNIQIVPGQKFGRKYALLYDGYYYDFELSDSDKINPDACEFSIDKDSYEMIEADSWYLWATVQVRLECEDASSEVSQLKFICSADNPTEIVEVDMFQTMEGELPVDKSRVEESYYLVRNFDATNRTIELCKVSVGPNDMDTATLITGVIKDWETYVVDENALYSGWGINGCANPYFEETRFMDEKVNCESYNSEGEYTLFATCGIRDGKVAFIQEVLNP